MKCNDTISIIVPVYNVESYLKECIESIINQTYKELEILLIDDGSTDGSGSICDEYKQKDNRIKTIHQNNRGISNARNVGLKSASGKYICFVDSDDLIHPQMVELLYNSLIDNDADISICHEISFSDNDSFVFDTYESYTKECIEDRIQLLTHTTDDWTGPINWSWNKIYKRELISGLSFTEQKRMEDVRFIPEYLINVSKGVWIKECLYGYRQRIGSTMNSNDSRIPIEYAEALLHQRSFIEKAGAPELVQKYDLYLLKKLPHLRIELTSCDSYTTEQALFLKSTYNKIYDNFDKSNYPRKHKLQFIIARYAFWLFKLLNKFI